MSLRRTTLAVLAATAGLSAYALQPAPDLRAMVEPCANSAYSAAARVLACETLLGKQVFSRIQRYQITQWQAYAYFDQSDWAGGQRVAAQAIALEPERPGGYRLMARAFAARKEFGRAAESQRKAVDRDPTDYTAWASLLMYLMASEQFGEAEAVLQRMPDWDERDPSRLYMRGLIRLQDRNFAGTTADARQILAMNSGDSKGHYLRRKICEASAADCWTLRPDDAAE